MPFQSVGRASRGDLGVTPSPRCVQGYLFWRESESHKDPDYLRRCLSAVFRVSRRSPPIPLWEVEVRRDSPSKPRMQSTKLRDTGICPEKKPMQSGAGASHEGLRGSGLWPSDRGPTLCDLGTIIRK